MYLKLLHESDCASLLDFESENRKWFEQFIPPREGGFYCFEGVRSHVLDFLSDYRQRQCLPMLVCGTEGEVIGRVNLHSLCMETASAYLGYRIGEQYTRRGVASFAVNEILQQARRIGLKKIVAFAATDNIASQKVLANNQFLKGECVKNYARLNGKAIHCYKYTLQL